MIEDVVKDYVEYLKLDVATGFHTVQDVIDNMLMRLEELTSVLQMIKLKNSDCGRAVSEDISTYRSDITTFSKKVTVINEIVRKLFLNIELLERLVEKAELDFGVSSENRIKSFLKPFLKRSKDAVPDSNPAIIPPNKPQLQTVLDNFEEDVD